MSSPLETDPGVVAEDSFVASATVGSSLSAGRDSEPLPEVVYSSRSELADPRRFVIRAASDLLASRELAYRLFTRDLRGQYRRSYLGYLWVLIPPAITAAAWIFLNRQGVLPLGQTQVPYGLYVLCGVIIWEGMVNALTAPLTSLGEAAPLMTKAKFPLEAPMLVAFAHAIFNSSIRATLLLPMFAFYQQWPPLTFVLLPFVLVGTLLCAFAVGLLLAPLGVLFPDVGRSIVPFTSVMFFVTPVVYAPPETWPANLIVWANPASPVLLSGRYLLIGGEFPPFGAAAAIVAAGLVLLIGSWILYRAAAPHLIARMGS